MEKIRKPVKKITQKIKTGTVSATFGIIVITTMLVFAGWSIYEKYEEEGLLRFPSKEGQEELIPEVIYEDVSGEIKEITTIIE